MAALYVYGFMYSVCVCCGWDESDSPLFYIGMMSEPSTSCGRPRLTAAMKRKHLTSTEDVCVCVCVCVFILPSTHAFFVLAYTEADANEDVRQLYN